MPARSATDPWSILRSAQAQLDPSVGWLEGRLAAPGAQAWLQQVRSSPPTATTDARTAILADAIRRAERVVAGDTAVTEGIDAHFLRVLWSTLAERATGPVGDLATRASVALERLAAPSPPKPAAAAVSTVGNYELLGVLGSGASGTVYRARHHDNGMPAAVKLLRLDAQGHEQIERFRKEARIASRLAHPALVRILDSGVHEQGVATPYLVSELVEGQPFSQALRGASTAAVLQAFAELCDGIAYAHRAGVLHRDLKPANVLVDSAGHPHVLDFGCARSQEGEVDSSTMTGQVLGTPAFMSREQANGKHGDPRSDQWSLGALLFDALAGEPPYAIKGMSATAALRHVAEAQPRRLALLRPDLGGDLAAVVDKAIASDAQLRYADVEELAKDVRRLLAGDPVSASPPTALQSLWRLGRRHRLATGVVVAFAACITFGGLAATVLWRRAVEAEQQLDQEATEAFTAVSAGMQLAAHLAETTTAAEEQLRLLEPAIAAVVRLQAISRREPVRWLRTEAGLREVAGDLAQRLHRDEIALAHRLRVLAIERQLMVAGQESAGEVARALVKLGDLERLAQPDAARQHYEEAHTLYVAVATNGSLAALDDLSWSYHRLAGFAFAHERLAEALAYSQQHLELANRLLVMSPDPLRQLNIASAISEWHKCGGRHETEAEDRAELERGLQCAEAAVSVEPDRLAYLSAARHSTEQLAMFLIARNELDRARTLLQRNVALSDEPMRRHPGDAEARDTHDMFTIYLMSLALRIDELGGQTTLAPKAAIHELALDLARQVVARLRPDSSGDAVGGVVAGLQKLGQIEEANRVLALPTRGAPSPEQGR